MSGDLVAFLRAQVDEDEAAAKALAPYWLAIFSHAIQPHAQRLARHDPARVLREVEAKRAILAQWADLYPIADSLMQEQQHGVYAGDGEYTLGAYNALTQALRHLAAVYRDHPDYRQEWAP